MSNPEQSELSELLRRNNTATPERADREALRQYFVAHPPRTWNIGIASLAFTGALANLGNSTVAVSTEAGAECIRKELQYADSPALERLAIDHVVLCWIHFNDVAFCYDAKVSKPMAIAHAEYWERRLTAAQRRYVRALETLARLRRLKLPALQVNIGANQVNVSA